MLIVLGLCIFSVVHALSLSSDAFRLLGPQAVKLWRLEQLEQADLHPGGSDETIPIAAAPSPIIQSTFTQPLDHFNQNISFTFEQRYWVNPQFYKSGGPVIILDGGETSGTGRLQYLITGIAAKLANATGGLALVLEHRYYGNSIPVANFSTDALRWLTNDQAAADSANFMAKVNFTAAGVTADLTAPGTPWIYYGGSYAGARSAHMRVLYPDLVYGAIASSGVTHASVSLWQYYDVVRNAAPRDCSSVLVKAVETINTALSRRDLNAPLKSLFGLDELHDDDFSSLISSPIGGWQNHNWDPAIDRDGFTPFCEAIAVKPSNVSQQSGYIGDLKIDYGLLNYANYSRTHFVSRCLQRNMTISECYGTRDDASFQKDDLSETWRAWQFQVCTAWGFFIDAPPANVPPFAARPLTAPYLAKICEQAYPPGEFFIVPKSPDVHSVNVLGGYHIAADRLAIIDGEHDPWRPATPHSSYAHLQPRPDTITRPFKLLSGTVHHWDENGLLNTHDEPPVIKAIHEEEIGFVKAWLKDWKPSK